MSECGAKREAVPGWVGLRCVAVSGLDAELAAKQAEDTECTGTQKSKRSGLRGDGWGR